MTPQETAKAIVQTRFSQMSPTSPLYLNILTAIVDGIERTQADHGLVGEANRHDRIRVARRYAEWHIGDADWANGILAAYRDPEGTARELDQEQEDQAHALGVDQ